MSVKSTNITHVEHRVSQEARWAKNGHTSGVVWFTGLSGAGKTTLAFGLEQRLFKKGYQVYVLDGDNARHGINSDLGFSPEDRTENIRRVGEVAALFARAGYIAISAFISPYRKDRRHARKAAGAGFHEVFIDADLDVCEQRDPKGLYKKARAGKIMEFTGISAPYETPENPELVIKTGETTVDQCLGRLIDYVDRTFAPSGAPSDERQKERYAKSNARL
ncbi:MAG TPA: adenylyl-sulfate kinase [Rhodospirillales bacterium]|nr:adenylyl-sulfate kinase [Rhodospirillales bacterium]